MLHRSNQHDSGGGVLKTFEKGGEAALLADALTVQGVVWARLGASDASINILNRAMQVAQDAGAPISAGHAALTLIEEHGAARRLSEWELAKVYWRADGLLRGTQDAEDKDRLLACARLVIKRLSRLHLHDKNFSLYGAVHSLEAQLIEKALEEAGGSVTTAAKLLGLKHQTFIAMLHKRHAGLLPKRKPAEKRRRSIIKKTPED